MASYLFFTRSVRHLIFVTLLVSTAGLAKVGCAQATTVVIRASPLPGDPAASPKTTGRFVIAIRDVDRPAKSLDYSRVFVRENGDSAAGGTSTLGMDAPKGVTEVDGIAPATYLVKAVRLGYSTYTLSVTMIAGCEIHVEIYLSAAYSCLIQCEQTPARATVTTCYRSRQ